jgi:hypothetical protein
MLSGWGVKLQVDESSHCSPFKCLTGRTDGVRVGHPIEALGFFCAEVGRVTAADGGDDEPSSIRNAYIP